MTQEALNLHYGGMVPVADEQFASRCRMCA
jgi:hypothetical protein